MHRSFLGNTKNGASGIEFYMLNEISLQKFSVKWQSIEATIIQRAKLNLTTRGI